jgi:Ca2+-binding EF-hand superfamily protein
MIHLPCLPSILVATLTALGATGLAQAQPTDDLAKTIQEVTEQFKVADKNRDGVVTRAEVDAAFPQKVQDFDAIDTAKAGKLTLEQIISAIKKDRQAPRDTKK